GLPAITVGGAVLTAMGVVGWAIAQAPWQLFLGAMLSGAGWVAMGAVAINTIIATWYNKNRPTALSKAYNGASVGGVVLSPLWVALIAWMGFAGAAATVGAIMVSIVLLLASSMFNKTPESVGQMLDAGDSVSVATHRIEANHHAPLPGSALW